MFYGRFVVREMFDPVRKSPLFSGPGQYLRPLLNTIFWLFVVVCGCLAGRGANMPEQVEWKCESRCAEMPKQGSGHGKAGEIYHF